MLIAFQFGKCVEKIVWKIISVVELRKKKDSLAITQ
jgi:hypothetical protein